MNPLLRAFWKPRIGLVAAGIALVVIGCAPSSPAPSTHGRSGRPMATQSTTDRTQPLAMNELRSVYEAQGLACQEYEQTQGGLPPGTNLGCEVMLGDGLLVIEAPYSPEGQLRRLISQLIVRPPDEPPIAPRDRERAVAIVLAVDYPGHDRAATEVQLREWLMAGPCDPGDPGSCEVRSGAGVWVLHTNPASGGWILRLDLDDDPPA